MISLPGDLEELRSLLLQRNDTTRLRISVRDGKERSVETFELRSPAVLQQVIDYLPDHYRPEFPDDDLVDYDTEEDEFPEESFDDAEVDDAEQEHDVPWEVLVEALVPTVGDVVRSLPTPEGAVHCRARLYARGRYLTSATLRHSGSGFTGSPPLAPSALSNQFPGSDPPTPPAGFAGPMSPMPHDTYAQALQAHVAANDAVLKRMMWGMDQMFTMLQRGTIIVSQAADQARRNEQAVRRQEREVREQLARIFQRMLEMRKEQLDDREAGLKAQLEDKREAARAQMMDNNIERGIDAIGKIGKLYVAREHPALLGLDDEMMDLMGTLGNNSKLRELAKHPKFSNMVADPKFADAVETMLTYLDTPNDGADAAS